ncbi:WXG100 family type VII secretion target [Streptomyces sp. NPDC052036]|uniref:WXG100 family type VII secretion target n=1 Tax=Streptomyces sp. NPDC052036 TaxID=3155171 RepID=UPI00341E1020
MAGSAENANLMVKEELAGVGTKINSIAQGIADELNRLINQLQPVLDGSNWSGAAALYFEGLQAEWNYGANGLLGPDGVLGEIARAMDINWGNYTEAEWADARTWRH